MEQLRTHPASEEERNAKCKMRPLQLFPVPLRVAQRSAEGGQLLECSREGKERDAKEGGEGGSG